MRIACISDTHGFHRKLDVPEAEVLVHAGDFSARGGTVEELDDFNAWLGELPHRHKIVVAGNHDKLFEADPKLARARLSNAVYLEQSAVTLDGIRFWGCPVTPVLPHMAFAVQRGAAGKYWDKIPDQTEVLITHGPPFGILDKENILAEHMGCMQLTKAVQRVRLRLHIFGHIHGGRGREQGPNGTQFVNCAVLQSNRLFPPIVVEIDHHRTAVS
jgi:Icc-related predicted phosphoesterase